MRAVGRGGGLFPGLSGLLHCQMKRTLTSTDAGLCVLKWSRPRDGGQGVDGVCYNPKSPMSRDPNVLGAFHVSSSVFDITGFSTVKKVTVERGDSPPTPPTE